MDAVDYGTPITPIEEEPKKSNRTILIIVAVVLVLCCCCVVFGALMYFVLGDMILEALDSAFLLKPLSLLL